MTDLLNRIAVATGDQPMTNSDIDALCGRLQQQAINSSKAQRQMAEAKSLRQADNPDRLTDLYSWPTPEQTAEGQARATILALRDQLAKAEGALRPFVEGASHTMVFLRSREKIHPVGLELYAEDVERARAYFAAKEPTP